MAKLIFGYWSYRGVAQPIRTLLAYLGVDFEDRQYTSKEEWDRDKSTLGLEFPTLPYLLDGDTKLSHTLTILRYLGRKYGLDGVTTSSQIRISLLEQHLYDLNIDLFGLFFSTPDHFPDAKSAHLLSLPNQLQQITNFLGTNDYSVADTPTYVDFWLYEYLIRIKLLAPEILQTFERLTQFIGRLESQPMLAASIQRTSPMRIVDSGPFSWAQY